MSQIRMPKHPGFQYDERNLLKEIHSSLFRQPMADEFLSTTEIHPTPFRQPDEDTLRRASALYHLNPNVPPTFIWHTAEDEMVHPLQSMKYAEGLYSLGISCELHVFDRGPHALALADDETVAAYPWMMLVLRWLNRNLK